jgi:hypothetical protein
MHREGVNVLSMMGALSMEMERDAADHNSLALGPSASASYKLFSRVFL